MIYGAKENKTSMGFTLIEILIALAISSIVLLVLISVFSNQQRVFSQQTDLTQSTAAARAAMQMMARDIRMAGYTSIPLGWEKLTEGDTIALAPVVSVKKGNQSIGNWEPYTTLGDNLSQSGDVIEIFGNFSRQHTSIQNPVSAGTGIKTFNVLPGTGGIFSGTGFSKPAYVIIGESTKNAISVEIHTINSVAADVITVNEDFEKDFGLSPGGMTIVTVAPLFRRVYYAAPDPAGNPTLWVANYDAGASSATEAIELARGVNRIEFSYDLAAKLPSGSEALQRNQPLTCNPCAIRGVTIHLWTISEKFRDNLPLLREFSHSVRVRNMGLETESCKVKDCST
jgi:prepilin-type N-terminal cleavage/methylation domain-containing protein